MKIVAQPECSQKFAIIKYIITVFHKHVFDVCEDSSKCEKRLVLAGEAPWFGCSSRSVRAPGHIQVWGPFD